MLTTSNTGLVNFSLAVDRLDSSGENWVIFKTQFEGAMRAQKVWKHFTRQAVKLKEDSLELEAWQEKEDLASHLLMQKLPDFILTKYMSRPSVAQKWSGIVSKFMNKSMLMQNNLHMKFLALCYRDRANLHDDKLRYSVALGSSKYRWS
ncbi:hypothetical protein BDQ17DRAFT_1253823 [Cyathus striatus]|nr:hypothetical protein BDQ17DRAFT_1253823 [Cyathus striatus]